MPGLETTDEMFDLRMSEGAKPLFDRVKGFIRAEVEPVTLEFFHLGEGRADRWSWAPGQLEQEINEGSWILAPVDPKMVLDTPPDDLWLASLSAIGIDPNLIVPGGSDVS